MNTINENTLKNAQAWLNDPVIDDETKSEIKNMMENNPAELNEAFYANLEFGTGGLRGIMGVGSYRMNKYTVGMATQGLANYLIESFNDTEIKVAIAYDVRNNSKYFAQVAANVLSANNIKVFLFQEPRPTPMLSFAVRHLNCQSGIVITASHNPKEYNGYKVYWDDGAQLTPPHDTNVIDRVNKIDGLKDVKFNGNDDLIVPIGEDVDNAYFNKLKTYVLQPDVIKQNENIKIVYTPIHGTGLHTVPRALKEFGFKNVILVEEQAVQDGNFPTVVSPNPEERSAMALALKKAEKVDADIILATDPDSDRLAVGLKNHKNEYVLLNGNQTAVLLTYYLIKQWKDRNKLTGNEFIVKTVVTSELMSDIAVKAGVEYYDVLTGFKWIAKIIRENEGKKTFIGGGEESFGYMVGDFVRDKDALISCSVFAECVAWANSRNMSLFEILIEIYLEYGFYKERLVNIVRKGISGKKEIKSMMDNYRNNPPEYINGSKVVTIKDYKTHKRTDIETNAVTTIDLPSSDVLQFLLEDGSKISVRPSGTEPKIKFYFSVKEELKNKADFDAVDEKLEKKLDDIISDMGLNN